MGAPYPVASSRSRWASSATREGAISGLSPRPVISGSTAAHHHRHRHVGGLAGGAGGVGVGVHVAVDVGQSDGAIHGVSERSRHSGDERAAAAQHSHVLAAGDQRGDAFADAAAGGDDRLVADNSQLRIALGADDPHRQIAHVARAQSLAHPGPAQRLGRQLGPAGLPSESIGTPTVTLRASPKGSSIIGAWHLLFTDCSVTHL